VEGGTDGALIRCPEERCSCAQTCTSCVDAWLGEQMVQQLTRCIRLRLGCADACAATGTIAISRAGSNQELLRQMLSACETACRACAEECRRCERARREASRSMRV
jgi:hypothetical protein